MTDLRPKFRKESVVPAAHDVITQDFLIKKVESGKVSGVRVVMTQDFWFDKVLAGSCFAKTKFYRSSTHLH